MNSYPSWTYRLTQRLALVVFFSLLSMQTGWNFSWEQNAGKQDLIEAGEIQSAFLAADYRLERSSIQTLHHSGASFLKVHFSRLNLPPGDFITVSDAGGWETYRYPDNPTPPSDTETAFWAMSVNGDTAVIELHSSLDAQSRSEAAAQYQGFQIDKYAWGYPQYYPRRETARMESICGVSQLRDVVCYQSSYPTEFNKGQAVARLLIVKSNKTYLCSASRISPANLILTNQHCISNQTETVATEAWFNYQNATCGVSSLLPVTKVSGKTLLAANTVLDFALFSVNNFKSITGFGYLDLDPRAPLSGEEIYMPSHAAGRPKQFGIESDQNSGNLCRIDFPTAYGNAPNTDTGYYCDTEGGSSGSPVLARSSHKVLALHHFGLVSTALCPRDGSNQGVRIDRIYPLVQTIVPMLPFGDLDHDQFVESDDLRFLANTLTGNTAIKPPEADVHMDEVVDARDLVILSAYLNGLVSRLPFIP